MKRIESRDNKWIKRLNGLKIKKNRDKEGLFIAEGLRFIREILLAEELNDRGNLGTVIRTADACGADAVFLSKGSVDLYNPKVLRATMGSLFHVPVFQNIDLHALSEKMQAKQIPLYAAHLKGDRYPYALPLQDACAFLIGNEARGLSEDAAALCDAWVKIPMPGQAESLNASVAAGVLLYEVVRQRLPK